MRFHGLADRRRKLSGGLRNSRKTLPAFAVCPVAYRGAKASNYEGSRKDFIVWLSQNTKVDLSKDPLTQLVSTPEESEGDFHKIGNQKKRERRDEMVENFQQKSGPKIAVSAEEKIEKGPAVS